jgi:hypothetical protein
MGDYRPGDLAWVEAKSVAVADQCKAWIAQAERLIAQRDQRDQRDRQPSESEDLRPSTRSEATAARLRAMQLAWEKRGRPWNEAEARAMLADLEVRGETRAYGPGGDMLR